MPPSLSIIVPAYNEAARLRQTLPTIIRYLEQEYPESELIVVDDGSSDDTIQVVEQEALKSRHIKPSVISVRPNRGKGHAVRAGLLAASAPIALFTDADLSTPMTETPKLIELIERGQHDLTFGSRALDRSLIGVHQPWRREQGGRVFNFLVRLATGLPYWDTQCGFKAFRMSVCRPFIEASTIERFGFDVEWLFIAQQAGLRLLEVPLRWDHHDGSKVSVFRDSFRMFNEVRLIRSQFKHGVYDEAIHAARGQLMRERERLSGDARSAESLSMENPIDLADATR